MKKNQIYNDYFFSNQEKGSYLSAKAIVPIVLKYVKIKSVVDFGCGLGTWLRVCQENGILDILGIDGSYIDEKKLYIDKKHFRSEDLNKNIKLNKIFDLAISLEVAEHIEEEKSDIYINNLTKSSNIILFSAAIPGQADEKIGHINEQWPKYWQDKFSKKGFIMLDFIRPKIFNNSQIDWWYRQNIFLLINKKLKEEKVFKNLAIYNDELKIVHQSIINKLI